MPSKESRHLEKAAKDLRAYQQKVNGVNYLTFSVIQDCRKHLDMIRGLRMQSDDVITIGFPRSGNHWVYEIVGMILRQETKFSSIPFYLSILDSQPKIQERLCERASPRQVSSHLRMNLMPLDAMDKRVKMIYMLRNPKDAISSMYRLYSSYREDLDCIRFDGTWEEFFELQMSGESPYGSWFDHVLDAERFIVKHPQHPIFVLSYERLKHDTLSTLKELCAFLDKPDELAGEIAAVTEFKNMKNTLRDGTMKVEFSAMRRGSDYFKYGEVGTWKMWFTVAQNEQFDRMFERKMAGSAFYPYVKEYLQL